MEEFEREDEMIEEEEATVDEYEAEDYSDEEEVYEESNDDYEEDDEPRRSVLKWILPGGLTVGGAFATFKIVNAVRIKKGMEPIDGPIAALKKRRAKKKQAELNAIIDGLALRLQANPEMFMKSENESEEGSEETED